MKTNKFYSFLFLILSGIVSVGYSSTANARFIAKCRTISQPGLYTLRTNLSSTGNCLIVNADHVTIDLNGYVISHTGDKRSESIGISGTITQGLHVHNGTISGYEVGIIGPKFSRLNALSITSNYYEGANLGEGSRVTSSIFAFNGFGSAYSLKAGKGTIVKDNTFYQNGSHFKVGQGSLVLNNLGGNGNEDGFDVTDQTLIIGNNLINTTDEGLRIVGSNSLFVNNNTRGNLPDLMFLGANNHAIGNAADFFDGGIPGCNFNNVFCREIHNFFIKID